MQRKIVFTLVVVSLLGGLLFNLISSVALAGDDDVAGMKQRLWENPVGMLSLTLMPGASQDAISLNSSASPTEPLDIGHAGIFTFQSFRDSNWNIYTAQATGLEPQRITSHEASDIRPRLTLDSSQITFSSNREGNYDIYTIDADGANLQRLADDRRDEVYPDWSPDGGQIAYARMRSNDHLAIYKMNVDGSDQQLLTSSSSSDDLLPTWSPDGEEIAWIHRNTQGWGSIRVMNAYGSNERALTENLKYIQNPRWSPDGSFIAFDYDADGDDWNEIVVLDVASGDIFTVYDPNLYLADAWMGSWSPDGQHLVTTLVLYEVIDNKLYLKATGFVRVDLASGVATALPGSGVDMHPDWQQTDFDPPISTILPLPTISASPFVVQWIGEDVGPAGIESFDVQVRVGAEGEWIDWHTETTDTEAVYQGQGGMDYYFRVRARDRAGHVETWPPDYEAMTTVESQPPVVHIEPLPDYLRHGSYIRWGGFDPGGSGIKYYDVQIRMIPEVDWQDWHPHAEYTLARFKEEVAETYEFRIRATDEANNVSTWSIPDADTTTTLYTWMVGGLASDNRARSLGELIVETAPPPFTSQSDSSTGAYVSYVAEEANAYGVQWMKPGYLDLPLTQLSGNQDQQQDVVLPPPDNVIQNWGFEGDKPDQAWDFTGISEVVDRAAHTGAHAVQLGNAGFFGEVEDLWWGSSPSIAVQNDGTLHLAFIGGAAGDREKEEIYHASRTPEGDWSSLQNISHAPSDLSMTKIIIDKTRETLHVMWWAQIDDNYRNYGLYHAHRNSQGIWLPPKPIPINPASKSYSWYNFAIDAGGSLHVAWRGSGIYGINVIQRSPDGGWSEEEQVTGHRIKPYSASFLVSKQGDAHFAWGAFDDGNEGTYYRRRNADGTWTTVEKLSSVDNRPYMALDKDNLIHIAWSGSYSEGCSICYRHQTQDGQWSPSKDVSGTPDYGGLGGMKIDHLGRLHFIFTPGQPWGNIDDSEIWYRLREKDGTWLDVENVSRTSDTWGWRPRLEIDETGAAHVLWMEQQDDNHDRFNLRYTRRSEQNGWSLPVIAAPDVWESHQLAVQPDGVPHVVWINGPIQYAGLGLAEQDAAHTVTQQIDIPAQLSDPTLSFLYRFHNIFEDDQGSFVVEIGKDAETTSLLRTSEGAADWRHAWFDVSPWLGERVTLSYRVEQGMAAPEHWADLDEVTIGSSAYPNLWIHAPSRIFPSDQPDSLIIRYGNTGDHLAANTMITVTLPSETSVIESTPPASMVDGQTLVWSVGDLAPTQTTETIEVLLELISSPPSSDLLKGHVEIRSDSIELDFTSNSADYYLYVDGNRYYLPLSLRE